MKQVYLVWEGDHKVKAVFSDKEAARHYVSVMVNYCGIAESKYKICKADVDRAEDINVLPCDVCEWWEDEEGLWHTECGEGYIFIDDDLEESGYRFCPYCGREIIDRAGI